MKRKPAVLFVCSGNICRSPTAEGVFRHLASSRGVAERLRIDSAGMEWFHVGDPPDARAMEHALRRGYDLSSLRARQVEERDFREFDRILAMDRGHLRQLKAMAPANAVATVGMFLDHSGRWPGMDVPDPYYGGEAGFEEVLDMVEEACARLLDEVTAGWRD